MCEASQLQRLDANYRIVGMATTSCASGSNLERFFKHWEGGLGKDCYVPVWSSESRSHKGCPIKVAALQQEGPKIEHKFVFLKLLATPGYPGKNPAIFCPNSLFSLGFQEHAKLFDPHLFPEDIRTQRLSLCSFFLPEATQFSKALVVLVAHRL